MLNRTTLMGLIFSLTITAQAQNFDFLQNNRINSQQEVLNNITNTLEKGLGRDLTKDELHDLVTTVLPTEISRQKLVRVNNPRMKSTAVFFCFWSNVAPVGMSFSAGTCSDISGNLYGLTLVSSGLALGLSGRASVLFYEGDAALPVDGDYNNGIMAEASVMSYGAHIGHFSNAAKTQSLMFLGWSGSILFAGGLTASGDNLKMNLQFKRIRS